MYSVCACVYVCVGGGGGMAHRPSVATPMVESSLNVEKGPLSLSKQAPQEICIYWHVNISTILYQLHAKHAVIVAI